MNNQVKNDNHVKTEFVGSALVVQAVSSEAKEAFRNPEKRDFLINNTNLIIDNFLIEKGYKRA